MKKMLMNYRAFALSALALALLTVSVPASAQQSDGPVRQGVRSATQGTAQAARRVGEATRNVIGGTADAVRGTGEAARNLGQGNRAGDQTYQGQNQTNQGRYNAGYRGLQQPSGSSVNTGQVYQLRYDASGREFICVCGHRVYFENQPQSYQAAKPVIDDTQSGQGAQGNQSGQRGNQSSPSPTPTLEDQSSDTPQQGQLGTIGEASSPQKSDAQSQSGSDALSTPQKEGGNVADSQEGASQNPPELPAEPANSAKLN